ncbi:MAG: hypothetical protein WDN45_08000 [Caulobacteraceae bacterium]
MDGKPDPVQARGQGGLDKHLAAAKAGDKTWDPATECLPEGLPRIMTINEPFEIMQRDKAVYFVAQNRVPWKAFFGEQLPADPDPFYMGYSVAKWDGPTLVMDSAGFRDITMLDDRGIPHTEQLHLDQQVPPGQGRQDHDRHLHRRRSRRLHPSLDRQGQLREEAGQLPGARGGLRREAAVDRAEEVGAKH